MNSVNLCKQTSFASVKYCSPRGKALSHLLFSAILAFVWIIVIFQSDNKEIYRASGYHKDDLDDSDRRIVLLSFSTRQFGPAMLALEAEARELGWFTDIELWNPKRLRQNCPSSLASNPYWVKFNARGFGLWAWKPSIIQFTIQDYKNRFPNSQVIVFYIDAGCALNNAPQRFFEYVELALKTGGLIFELPFLNKDYCRKDILMKVNTSLANTKQLVGGIIALDAHSNAAHQAINDWNELVQLERGKYLKDPPRNEIQFPGFKAHRHDQSLWSLVARRYGFYVLGDETWHGPEWKPNNYPIWAVRRKV